VGNTVLFAPSAATCQSGGSHQHSCCRVAILYQTHIPSREINSTEQKLKERPDLIRFLTLYASNDAGFFNVKKAN
jgi:hypothetical protein